MSGEVGNNFILAPFNCRVLDIEMPNKKYLSLEDLRKRLTDTQRSILDEIWRYWREEQKIITAVALYNQFGKEVVESSVGSLGGSIAFRNGNESGRKHYQLTFLGILLSASGPEAQQLLEKYLDYLHTRLASEPELSRITREDFERDLHFTDKQFDLFTKVLHRSPFWRGGGDSIGSFYLPYEVDDLAITRDIHNFLEERALRDYDPNKPIDQSLQLSLGKTIEGEEPERADQLQLTKTKLWILGLGAYVLYALYVVSSIAGRYPGGLFAFKYREPWWLVLGQTLWFLIAVLAALLLASVLGPAKFLDIVHILVPFTRRLSLLSPIQTKVPTTLTFNGSEIEGESARGAFSDETGLGFQLYLDYNESIKKVYNNAILQYRNSFYLSLIFATVGFGVIFYTLVFRNDGNTSWPAVVVSAIIEAVPALFFYLSDKARKQMIDVFVDLRHDNEVARAYELLRTLKNTDRREVLKEEIICHTLLKAPQEKSASIKPTSPKL